MKAAMAGTGGAGDSRRWTMLDKSLRETRSEGRGVMATGGALARRRGVLVSAGVYARPPTMQKTTGGAESSPVTDMLAGLGVVAAIHVKTTGGALARRNISEATSVSELQGRLHAVFPATADGIGQYEGIGNPTAQPQQMASAGTRASATLQLSHSGWRRPRCGPVRGHRFALGSQRSMPRWHGATVRKIGRSQ